MKNILQINFYKIISLLIICILLPSDIFAAKIILKGPTVTSSNGEPFVVQVFISTEGSPISSVAGSISLSKDLFDIETISTKGTVIPFWVTKPSVVSDPSFESNTVINFEGIFPGGYIGVRRTSDDKEYDGLLFNLIIRPKNKGTAIIDTKDLEVHAYDKDATLIPVKESNMQILVTGITPSSAINTKIEKNLIESDTLKVTLNRDPLIEDNSWYVYVNEDESIRPISNIEIAETNNYSYEYTPSITWKNFTNPYILKNQKRDKYIHLKVSYIDNTFAVKTIPPVENSTQKFYLSSILIMILIIALVLIIFILTYGKNYKNKFFKK